MSLPAVLLRAKTFYFFFAPSHLCVTNPCRSLQRATWVGRQDAEMTSLKMERQRGCPQHVCPSTTPLRGAVPLPERARGGIGRGRSVLPELVSERGTALLGRVVEGEAGGGFRHNPAKHGVEVV
jgi:hypothetical protein